MQKRSRDDRPQSVLAQRLRRAADVVRREAAVLQYDRPNVAELKSSWLKVRGELAYVKLLFALGDTPSSCRPPSAACEGKYSPDQPRVPAGNADGGQWTSGGGASGGASRQVAQNNRGRGSTTVRAGGQTFEATPAQLMRLSNATNAAEGAIARVRERDPTWRPTPGLYNNVEGAIAQREAEAAEAGARLRELEREASGEQGLPYSFGRHKSNQKWQNQMRDRGWTLKDIEETLLSGKQYPAINQVNPTHSATRYENQKTGQSLVRDNVTGEILQLGGVGFKY